MNFDYEDLYKWVEDHTITRQKRNINRDFSDATPLVEILKFHYPKLVEVHNYVPKNSFAQKMINWQILNKRVLNKLKINLTNDDMEKLANAVPGEIEKILSKVKTKIETKGSEEIDDVFNIEALSTSSTTGIVPIRVKDGGRICTRKVVPVDVLDKMERDLTEKDEAIQTLRNKVEHLENLLGVKDSMIKNLNQQLEGFMNSKPETGSSNKDSTKTESPRSRFFKLF